MAGGWGTAGFATGFSRGLGDVFSPYLVYMMMSQEGKAKKATMQEQELLRRTLAGKGGPTPEVLAGMTKPVEPQMGVLPPDMQREPIIPPGTREEYWKGLGAGTSEEVRALMDISKQVRLKQQQENKERVYQLIKGQLTPDITGEQVKMVRGLDPGYGQIAQDYYDRTTMAINEYLGLVNQVQNEIKTTGKIAGPTGKRLTELKATIPKDIWIDKDKLYSEEASRISILNAKQLLTNRIETGKKAKIDAQIAQATKGDVIRQRGATADMAELNLGRKQRDEDLLFRAGPLGGFPTAEEIAEREQLIEDTRGGKAQIK